MATDVVGYSRLMGGYEVGTLTALKRHRAEMIDLSEALTRLWFYSGDRRYNQFIGWFHQIL